MSDNIKKDKKQAYPDSSTWPKKGFISLTGIGSYVVRNFESGNGVKVVDGDGTTGDPVFELGEVSNSELISKASESTGNINLSMLREEPNNNKRGYYLQYNFDDNNNDSFGLYRFQDNAKTEILKHSMSNDTMHFNKSISMQQNNITNLPLPSSNDHAANKQYVDSKAGNAGDNNFGVNTNGGNDHWLRRSSTTRTGITIYNQDANSFLFEDRRGESSGLAVNGDRDGCTIWSPGDSGSHLNIQDEDSSNSRVAYVNTSGSWVQVSSKKRKYSIKPKVNNDVLERLLKLSVNSYGYTYEERSNSSQKRKNRINQKANKMHIGLILEELFEIFPNCIPDYYNALFQKKDFDKRLNLEEEIQDIQNSGIDYNTLLCYLIMAFQEYVCKTNKEIENLKTKLKI